MLTIERKEGIILKQVMKEAVHLSFPVMVGYVFLGFAFGLLCQNGGYSWWWALLISMVVYAGSMQFVLLTFFHAGFSLVEACMVTLSVNARQIFYGISFLKDFQEMGKKKWYMIFSLTDETYSLLCAIPDKNEPHGKQLMFFVSFFDQLYWIAGSVLGAVLGSVLSFDSTGIDFAMTALFTVIFVEQWLASKNHVPVYVALLCIIVSALVFGLSNFLLPALVLLVVLLALFQKQIEEKEDQV